MNCFSFVICKTSHCKVELSYFLDGLSYLVGFQLEWSTLYELSHLKKLLMMVYNFFVTTHLSKFYFILILHLILPAESTRGLAFAKILLLEYSTMILKTVLFNHRYAQFFFFLCVMRYGVEDHAFPNFSF